MKKARFVVSFLAVALSFSIASCNEKPVEHTHTYAEAWTYDDVYHWHCATCEHKDEISEKAVHTFEKGEVVAPTKTSSGYTIYRCPICGFSKNGDYVNPIDPYEGRIKDKDFQVINLSYERVSANDPRFYDDAKPLSTYLKADTYKLYYLDQIDDVYYLPLATYVDLLKGDFKDGVVNTVTEKDGISTWTSTLNNETYTLAINRVAKTITVSGDISGSFKGISNGRSGLYNQAKFESGYVEGHEGKTQTFSFNKNGFDIFDINGKTCFPFALIAAETSKYIPFKFLNASYYNYLIEYADSEQYTDFTYLDSENKEAKFTDMISNSYKELYGVDDGSDNKLVNAPQSLSEFNKKIIYYLFDNYYGLASVKGIKSMSDYFENLEISSSLFNDPNGIKRGSAYHRALESLNDLHTAYGYSRFMDENASNEAMNSQSLFKDRTNLKMLLSTLRDQEIAKYNEAKSTDLSSTQVRYSEDGKYAYFSFDQFNTYNYYEEGAIPESELLTDSYYLFVKNLQEIKAKGTVKRVFIDDSQNGGGYVAIMGKLLALLSKDNRSTMYMRDQGDDSIQKIVTRVDSDGNGVFDEKDCFGNDFDFYIVTSSYSFSCGNAFPYYADKCGFAKIVGVQSGGGECAVYNYVLPTGQSITYSSPFHIGQYDESKKTFEGDEDGAYPWLLVSKYFSLYNVDTLGAFVTQRQPFAA